MKTYKVIETPPYDKDAPSTFWVKREVRWFGILIHSMALGDYKMDDDYGYMGQAPFFDRESAEKRLEILKQ